MQKQKRGPDPERVDRATPSGSKEFCMGVPIRRFHLRLLTVLPSGEAKSGRRGLLPLKLIWKCLVYDRRYR